MFKLIKKTQIILLPLILSILIIGNAIAAGEWSIEYDHSIVIVPVDDIHAPIEIEKPKITMVHEKYGRVIFSDGMYSSVTSTPLVKLSHPAGTTFNYRPTLFITICGLEDVDIFSLKRDCEEHVGRVEPPEYDGVDRKLMAQVNNYQYKHYMVQWENNKEIRRQAEDLSGYVNDFLNKRSYPWDVVVFGYSRGGIFAFELLGKITSHNKINKIHAFLLDPTAAIPWGDKYPKAGRVLSNPNYFGSLYYDNESFLNCDVDINIATDADENIIGYNNYNRNNHLMASECHEKFFKGWLAASSFGLDQALVDVMNHKSAGVFVVDGLVSSSEVVNVSAPGGLDIDLGVDVTDEHLNVWTNLSLDGIPVQYVQAAIGVDGSLEVSGGTAVSQSYASIDHGHASVSQSTLFESYTASISLDNITVEVDVLGVFDFSVSVDTIGLNSPIVDLLSGGGGRGCDVCPGPVTGIPGSPI